ncbi:hypothetical protein C8R43DRAFT_1141861 [Mycena crocata]|nr:hypothetical protein C8R43DRAFT_1141861 [Mycena crocata]
MPLPSSTTSLVADGGDDLDDDDRLSFALTAAASPSSSATSSSKSALSRGSLGLDPDLAVSDSADGLGGVGTPRCTGPGSERRNASPTRSPAPTAHFGSESAHAFVGFIWVSSLPPQQQPTFAILNGAPRIKPRVGLVPDLCSLFEPYRHPRIHTDKPRAFRRWLNSATQKYSTAALSMPILDSVVADWLLPRTPKSFTNVANAIFCLELVSLDFKNQLILTFESDFLLQTVKSDSLKTDIIFTSGGILIGSDFPPLLRYGRDYLRLALIRRLATLQDFVELHRVLVSWVRRSLTRPPYIRKLEFCVPKGCDYLQNGLRTADRTPLVSLIEPFLRVQTLGVNRSVETIAGQYTFELRLRALSFDGPFVD